MKLLKNITIPVTAASGRDLSERLVELLLGLSLYGIALALFVRANIGVGPWDVLSLGIVAQTGLGYGLVTVLLSGVVLLLWIPLRQRVGLGSVLNSLCVGTVAGITLTVLPEPEGLVLRIVEFAAAMLLLSFATGLYVAANFGPGPRDGLMTGLVRKLGWPVWLVRTMIEGSVLLIGWLLGGPVGIGTVIFAFGIGPLIQMFLGFFVRRRAARTTRETERRALRRAMTTETHLGS
ncbi:YczE/YyaS/YitT family protein [Humidisolicoccus flavus]|uniref:membrane protein YczE n=1 Tax=Humidisolicoccus flavus TaxID=3111414 RepID=UPI00324D7635